MEMELRGVPRGVWLKKRPTAMRPAGGSRDERTAARALTQWPPPWFPLTLPSPWLPFWSDGRGCPSGGPWGGGSEFVDGVAVDG